MVAEATALTTTMAATVIGSVTGWRIQPPLRWRWWAIAAADGSEREGALLPAWVACQPSSQ